MARSKGNKKSFGLVRWILVIICAIIVCGSAGYILTYVKDKVDAEKEFEALKSHNLSELYAQNSDLVGWIHVPGTKIDYPVMQTPSDPEFYLHRDFGKEYSDSGTPFLDALEHFPDGARKFIETVRDLFAKRDAAEKAERERIRAEKEKEAAAKKQAAMERRKNRNRGNRER